MCVGVSQPASAKVAQRSLGAGVFGSFVPFDFELLLFEFKLLGLVLGFAGALLPLLSFLAGIRGFFFAEFAEISAGAYFLAFKCDFLDALPAILQDG